MKPIRILLLADAASPHTIKWVTSLAESGHSVSVFSFSAYNVEDYKHYPEVLIKTLNLEQSLVRQSAGAFSKLTYVLALPALMRWILNFKPDIVHSHYASSYGLIGALSGFKPYFISLWGSDVFEFPKKSFLHRRILQFNLNSANAVFSTSNVMAIEAKNYSIKKAVVIPFGIDLKKFKPGPKRVLFSDNAVVIGTIKSLEDIYGISFLIEAFAELKKIRKENLKLLILGKGSKQEELKLLAERYGISQDITFAGFIPHNDIPDYHNSMDIEVYPSIFESFGVSVIEAGACEKPVIVSGVGGLAEIVENSVSGMIVPAKDAQSIAGAISTLLDNPDLRISLGKNARKRVMDHYDWQKNVQNMIDIYAKYLTR